MPPVPQSKSKENDGNEKDLRVFGREFLEPREDEGDFKESASCELKLENERNTRVKFCIPVLFLFENESKNESN